MLNQSILLVDDEEIVCRGCQRILEAEGYSMDLALSGKDGLKKALSRPYDVVITDMKMPDISGMEMIRELKHEKPEMPVIMITGYASVSTAVEAMKTGADDYIPKPFEPDEIISSVKNVLAKAFRDTEQEAECSPSQAIIDREQVMAVLNRTIEDDKFCADLMSQSSKTLTGYNLSSAAKAAIVTGDINWIRKHVGELTDAQLAFLMQRLQRESW
jgi:DNA-binding NtrC family response regulator